MSPTPSARFPSLETERLTLRELTPADADRMFEIHSNADAMGLFGNDPMIDQQQAVDFIPTTLRHKPWRAALASLQKVFSAKLDSGVANTTI